MSKPESGFFSGTIGGNSSSPLIQKSVPSIKRKAVSKKTNVSKRITVSKKAMEHSSKGDYTYPNKSKNSNGNLRLAGGGHSQECIKEMKKEGIQYNVTIRYKNGVRVGNVPTHKQRNKRTGDNQSWFPKNWTRSTIRNAAKYVCSLKKNQGKKDGVILFGVYRGVRVGVIKTNGRIATIFPDARKQPGGLL